MKNELLLVTCLRLEHEVRTVLETEGWTDVKVHACQAICIRPHDFPAVAQTVASIRQSHPGTCQGVGCGPICGCLESAGGQPPDHRRIACCADLVIGTSLASAWRRDGAFLLTPGWLSRWQQHLQAWGFDQTVAKDFFAESTSRLTLLDTGVDPTALEHLRAFGAFVERPTQVVPVGLDHFRLHLTQLVSAWRERNQKESNAAALGKSSRMLADYAMSYDLVSRLTGLKSETKVIEAIFELFVMLFAPATMVYLPVNGGKPGVARFMPESAASEASSLSGLAELRGDHAWTESNRGFLLRVGGEDAVLGLLKVDDIAFPQYREHYLNMGLNLAQVCGLAVQNARVYEQLEQTIAQLKEAMTNIRTLRGIIPICAGCKKIRDDKGFWSQVESYVMKHSQAQFSHGLCPECLLRYYPDAS
jgi:hypothetical protein